MIYFRDPPIVKFYADTNDLLGRGFNLVTYLFIFDIRLLDFGYFLTPLCSRGKQTIADLFKCDCEFYAGAWESVVFVLKLIFIKHAQNANRGFTDKSFLIILEWALNQCRPSEYHCSLGFEKPLCCIYK